MTTATATATANRVTFPRVVAAEWVKLRTLRSSYWCAAIAIALSVAAAVFAASVLTDTGTMDAVRQDTLQVTFATLGTRFTQLIVCIFGALLIGGEYASGMIRTTFLAVPRRWPAIAGKAIVLAVAVLVVSAVATFGSALIDGPLLASRGIDLRLGDPDVLAPLAGACLYLALLAVFALLIGVIVRNTAAAIAITLGLLLVVPTILGVIGGIARATWLQSVVSVLPSSAGERLYDYTAGSPGGVVDGVLILAPPFAALAMLGWVALAAAIAVPLVQQRDA